jgi:heterodisulfide reductase subunit A-like polyferredoxin
MAIGRRDLLKGIAVGAAGGLTVKGAPRDSGAVIFRDVCVLGGGSSGTYTAVRLRDLGKSVVVVESKGRLASISTLPH